MTDPVGVSQEITADVVRRLFHYDDGHLFHKAKSLGGRKMGARAGAVTRRGYVNVLVEGKMQRAHRMIFLWHNGWLPKMVDHIDGNRANNRIENLRACNESQNGMNRHAIKSKTGFRNVYKDGNTYAVSLMKDQKFVYVGRYARIEEAAAAAESARGKHFGEFA